MTTHGRREGHALHDWLEAEREIRKDGPPNGPKRIARITWRNVGASSPGTR